MNTYSPNFFKDDFTVNKNHFKNQVHQASDEKNESVPFKVVKIKKDSTKTKLKSKSLMEKAKDRINNLMDYFSAVATKYFSEEVV